jgi:CubicO group peptidase (beta-lactamase class C family)
MSPRAEHPDSAKSVTRNLRNLPVVAPLRSKHIYNNMMYTVLTHLIEVKTQESFSVLLLKWFFKPLGMKSSVLQPACAREKDMADCLAMGYHWDKDKKLLRPVPIVDMPEGQGAGSIVSSVNDMILWVKGLMNREQPITERLYQELIRLRSIPDGRLKKTKPFKSPSFYAAGLQVYWYRGYMVVGHDGGIPGFGSKFFFLPDVKFGAVLIGNSGQAHQVIGTLVKKLIDGAIGIPSPAMRSGKQRITKQQFQQQDNAAATTQASDLDEDDSSTDWEQPGEDKSREVQYTSLTKYTGTSTTPATTR